MPAPIDTAYIDIRPDFTGFAAETQRGVARNLAGVEAFDSKGLRSAGRESAAARSGLRGLAGDAALATGALNQLGGSAGRLGQLARAGGPAAFAVGAALGLKASVDAAIEFESGLAGIRKTVDASEGRIQEIGENFRDLSTEIPVSTEELLRLGEAAGQLGIRTSEIEGFVETVAKLGVTTNLSSDVAADALARLANITQLPQGQFDELGSTIVGLGNKSAATEAEIVEFGLRISGAGHQIGLTQSEILSFGTALASLGLNAEAGGTAISTLFARMASDVAAGGAKLKQFATIAGTTSEAFAAQFAAAPAQAVTQFIEGLGKITDEGGNVFAVLEELGLGGIRVRDTLLRTAGAGDLLSRTLAIGADEWAKNNALQNEAQRRFDTTASKLQLAENSVRDLGVELGEPFLGPVGIAADQVVRLGNAATDAVAGLKALAGVEIPVIEIPFNITIGGGKVGSAIGGLLKEAAKNTPNLGPLARGIEIFLASDMEEEANRNIPKLADDFTKSVGGMLTGALAQTGAQLPKVVQDAAQKGGGFGSGLRPGDLYGPLIKGITQAQEEALLDARINTPTSTADDLATLLDIQGSLQKALDDPRLKTKGRLAIKQALDSVTGQITGIRDAAKQATAQAADEAERAAKTAKEARDRAFLSLSSDRIDTAESRVSQARGDDSLRNDIAANEGLRRTLRREMDLVRERVRDVELRNSTLRGLTNKLNEAKAEGRRLRGEMAEDAREDAEKRAQDRIDAAGDLVTIAELRGAEGVQKKALDLQIKLLQQRVNGEKKNTEAWRDALIDLETAKKKRRELVEDAKEESDSGGTSLADLFSQQSGIVRGAGFDVGAQIPGQATDAIERQVNARLAIQDPTVHVRKDKDEIVGSQRDLIAALQALTTVVAGNTAAGASKGGGTSYAAVQGARGAAMGRYWQSRKNAELHEERATGV